MIKSNKNMLKMLVALAFTMSPVFAVAACNPSTKDDQAKLKTGDLNKLRIISPEIEAFNNVKDKTAVTTDEITTVVNTIVKTAIDQIVTKTNLNVDYHIKIEKDATTITGTYDLTSKTDFARTFDITVIKTQTAKLKGIHKSQSIVFPKLKEVEEVGSEFGVTKTDLRTLTNIDSAIAVEATETTNTSADMIKTAVEAKILEVIKKLTNAKDVLETDLDINVKKRNGTDDLDATTSLENELTVSVTVKASKIGEAKLEGTKTITVKIAKITPVVVKADLSKLEAIDSAIAVEATETTNTSADMIKTAVEAKILEVIKKLTNAKDVLETDLDINVKKQNSTDDLDATTSLENELTVSVTVKASKIGEAKLEGTKTITVKIAKITPVVVKADLSKLEAIDSAIAVEATETTNTSADMIKTAVEAKILEVIKKLTNAKDVLETDLDINVKKQNGTDDLDATTSLENELTVSVTVKASKIGEAKLEGTKTITVKIAKITPVVVKADLSKLEAIDSAIAVEATETTNTSADMIKTAVEAKILEVIKKLTNAKDVLETDLDINVKKRNGTDDLDATTSLENELTVSVTVKASKIGEAKLEGTKTITVKIAKITPVVVKADLSKLEAIDSAIAVEATETTNTSADMIKTAVEAKILEVIKKLTNAKDVLETDLDINVKKQNGTDDLDATTSLENELTVSVTVKASKIGEAKLEGTKTITVKIAKITPVVVKADLSKLEAIDSAIAVEATETTNTSADMIKTAVEAKILEVIKKLTNAKDVLETDLDINVKKQNGTDDLDATTSLENELTVSVTVKASKIGEAKLEGTKTITVKIAKITPVVVKADLSKLEAIDSAIAVEATETTNTSADMIKTAVEAKILEVIKKLTNAKDVLETDLDINVKKQNGTDDLDATTSLENELTVSVTVKASKIGEAKLEGTKTITVKIAQLI
ncbi:hypothetical protein [Spiroplasma endosymbiont of Clivina fossor]|uniref:hypothetical protein n=1 Tax=Spiroplasma endosymbiont of Clivina fossor TaxID=3066282 RepID=UPI00313B5492